MHNFMALDLKYQIYVVEAFTLALAAIIFCVAHSFYKPWGDIYGRFVSALAYSFAAIATINAIRIGNLLFGWNLHLVWLTIIVFGALTISLVTATVGLVTKLGRDLR